MLAILNRVFRESLTKVRFKCTPQGGAGSQPLAVWGKSIPGKGPVGKEPGLSEEEQTAGESEREM